MASYIQVVSMAQFIWIETESSFISSPGICVYLATCSRAFPLNRRGIFGSDELEQALVLS
jgi:hypothetical protein